MTIPEMHNQEFNQKLAVVSQEFNLTGPQVRIITKAYGKIGPTGLESFWRDGFDHGAWMLQQLPGQPVPAVLQAAERDFSTETHNGPPEVDDMQVWMDANPGKMWPPEDESRERLLMDPGYVRVVEALEHAKRELRDADPTPEFIAATAEVTEAQRHTKHAYGCFQAAADDEPIFTLRAKDAFAPGLILQWCALAEQAHLFGATDDQQTMEDWEHFRKKVGDARHCAQAMVEWQRNNTHKIPD